MGQSEILSFLEEHSNDWFSFSDLSRLLSLSRSSISQSLKQLRKRREVSFKSEKNVTNHFTYYHKFKK